jgi:hypothetical protein
VVTLVRICRRCHAGLRHAYQRLLHTLRVPFVAIDVFTSSSKFIILLIFFTFTLEISRTIISEPPGVNRLTFLLPSRDSDPSLTAKSESRSPIITCRLLVKPVTLIAYQPLTGIVQATRFSACIQCAGCMRMGNGFIKGLVLLSFKYSSVLSSALKLELPQKEPQICNTNMWPNMT